MALKPVSTFTPRLPHFNSVLTLKGPFNGTHVSVYKRFFPVNKLLTLRCYCDIPVFVTLQIRHIAHWVSVESVSGSDFGFKVKLLGKAQDVRFIVTAESDAEGVVEVVAV